MSDLDLCYLTATEALDLFRKKDLSPLDLTKALIQRTEEIEPEVNAFTFRYFDEALKQAKLAESRFKKGDVEIRALEGLPITVKDSAFIKGKPTSSGSKFMKDFVSDSTSVHVERILKAGGIVLARSATPEFCCAATCHSLQWGVTRNPWNREYTPGGSSGGSGASLAAGTSLLATGSDIAGSIRIPASCSGVIGYKPPYGRNPGEIPFNLDFYCHTGPMARSLSDTIMLQNVMCGPHPQDITMLRPKLRLPSAYASIKGWKIGYSMDLGFFELEQSVVRNTLKALEVFKELGASLEEVDLNWDWSLVEAGQEHLNHIFGTSIALSAKDHWEELTDYARDFAEKGQRSTAKDFLHSLEKAADAYKHFGPILERLNLFICPTTAVPAVPADFNQANDELIINGTRVNPILGWVMTTPFNTLSRCPVLSVPSGFAPNGVPTGIQLVGKPYADLDVFQAGCAYEKAVGGWYKRKAARPSFQ